MSILAALQAKVDAVDSSTSMSEILKLMYTVKDHPYKSVYDSAGGMPLDSASIGSIRYADNRNAMYMLVGVDSGWKLIDSDAATAATSATTPSQYGAGNYAFTAGGFQPSPTARQDMIDRYSLSSDAPATDVGNLLVGYPAGNNINASMTGGKSSTHGYFFGMPGSYPSPYSGSQKFPFASTGNTSQVPEQTGLGPHRSQAHTSPLTSPTDMYFIGGYGGTPPGGTTIFNEIVRTPSSSDAAFSDHGDLISALYRHGANYSGDAGYSSGGLQDPPGSATNAIDKFLFAANVTATDQGDLTTAHQYNTNSQSSTHGYRQGATNPSLTPIRSNIIDKFAFASTGNATDVGDLTVGRSGAVGSQNTTHGYTAGGFGPSSRDTTIDKYPFASDGNATDVGDILGGGFNSAAGTEY